MTPELLEKKLSEIDIVVFDLETTGLSAEKGDDIVEIGAMRMRCGETVEEFHSLANPGRSMPADATRVNHIHDEMLVGAPRIEEVLPKFLEFIGNAPLVAQNAQFDLSFLAIERRGEVVPQAGNPVFDTFLLAKSLRHDFKKFSLGQLALQCGIDVEPLHRALSDVEVTRLVFLKLVETLEARLGREARVNDVLKAQGGSVRWPLYDSAAKHVDHFNSSAIDFFLSAAVDRRTVTITYRASDNTKSVRPIVPELIVSRNGRTYLVADCLLRNEKRSFRLDRIKDFLCESAIADAGVHAD